jgi:hypothetical protein
VTEACVVTDGFAATDVRDDGVGMDGKGVIVECIDTVGNEGNADGDLGFEMKLAVALVEGGCDATRESEENADEEDEILFVADKDTDGDPDVEIEDKPLGEGNAISESDIFQFTERFSE